MLNTARVAIIGGARTSGLTLADPGLKYTEWGPRSPQCLHNYVKAFRTNQNIVDGHFSKVSVRCGSTVLCIWNSLLLLVIGVYNILIFTVVYCFRAFFASWVIQWLFSSFTYASATMLRLYHILVLLVVIVSFQCASSQIGEQHTLLPIYDLIELFLTPDINNFSDCSTNFKTLERALYLTDNNRYALISAFYPARESTSLFVNVKYNFSTPENHQTELNICHNWLWTTGTFYLIQSPDVFLFTSLLFVHPENKVRTLKLTLPSECGDLAYTCGRNPNNVSMLEILTRRVSLMRLAT